MVSITRTASISIALASAVVLAPAAGHAQTWIKPGEETLLFRLGGLTSRIDTSVRLDGNQGGTGIDLEGDTGLSSDRNTFFLGGTFRFASKHRFDALYDENKRSASRTTERQYVIDDIVIPAGTVLSAENKTALGYLGYRYSFHKSPTSEFAAGLGMYGGNFKFKFNANTPQVNVDASTTLPLPVLTLTGDFYLTERMMLRAGIQGLKVKINSVDGSVFAANVAGEYMFTNNLGVGVDFEYFDLEADGTKGSFSGNAALKTSKAILYLNARF